ncbi:MAG TPA: site-2 protease family protein [Anaerolineaceae bacterium]|nr:site-2 protease family protein [Anaerolineaceae bacterium]HPN52463.1 site-2 protease family protein [Anaerolineaceae bacterium]
MFANLYPSVVIARIIVLVISFSIHEFAHAWTANAFGDDTPRLNGRLTLNPASHLDLVGTLMLIVAGFGWARPVPVDPYALRRRSPAALMWVSLAGPASNLAMAVLCAVPFRLGLFDNMPYWNDMLPTLPQLFLQMIVINLTLMLFNLIPLAPLDGEKVLDFLLPPQMARGFEAIRPYGPMILMAMLFLLPAIGIDLIGMVMTPVMNTLTGLLLM